MKNQHLNDGKRVDPAAPQVNIQVFSLCGRGGFRGATRLFEGTVAFGVCIVFLRLLACGNGVFFTCGAWIHVEPAIL
jgi:hypothetical protein